MAAPKAPKDPTKKGSSFYICRQKDIAGNPQKDGSGIQFIYLNDVRLITFAKMVGNVTDEAMLEQLKTAEGFRQMVAGIGVTVEAEDQKTPIDFVFQMYGKTDPNNSGTSYRLSCIPDGMENIIWLDEFPWNEDNDIPGQMRFHFKEAGSFASVSVRLYLREGYEAPEQEEANPICVESEEYQSILKRSLLSMGNYSRLKKLLEKAKSGQQVVLSFIGGSVTQGAGAVPIHLNAYAYKTWEGFKQLFGENAQLIKAGVGGTPSELGMIRFERDVLREGAVKPDLVVIEFAVNDEGDETKGLCYESLVRKALSLSEDTAVILLFSVFADDYNLQQRLSPVGYQYELPMVSIKDGVTPQFYLKAGEGKVLSKSQFFYDSYHPSNIGHKIMADCILHLLTQVEAAPACEVVNWQDKEAVFGDDFTYVRLADKMTNADKLQSLKPGSFQSVDTDLQYVEMDDQLVPKPEFPYNWQHVQGSEPFTMEIQCKSLLVVTKDSGSLEYGKAICRVDGEEVRILDPREVGWTHCNAQILINDKESKLRKVEIAMLPGDENKKMTILGFGYVE